MNTPRPETLQLREFTRREKTQLRQRVKRFEKIGRDHHCAVLEDYVNFVRDRFRVTDQKLPTDKSAELVLGLIAYVGDRLIRATDLERIAVSDRVLPGGLIRDPNTFQTVFVDSLVLEQIVGFNRWVPSLDEIFDQLVDWNLGYLCKEDLQTTQVWDPEIGLQNYLAA